MQIDNNKLDGGTTSFNTNDKTPNSENVKWVINELENKKVKVLYFEEEIDVDHRQESQGKEQHHQDTMSRVVVAYENDYGKMSEISIFVPLDGDEQGNGMSATWIKYYFGPYTNTRGKLYNSLLVKLIDTKINANTKVTMDMVPLETSFEQEQVDKHLAMLFKAALDHKVVVVGVKSNYVEVKAPNARRTSNVVINLVPEGGMLKYKFTSGSKVENVVHTKTPSELFKWLSPLSQ